ncbi:hypothetical protein BGW38_005390, partial [Lunasporangiospora selenospora]
MDGSSSNSNTSTAIRRSFRNMQPRSAAAIDFNESEDDESGLPSLLSADYRAQKRTTQDLVDFFRRGPPLGSMSGPGLGHGPTGSGPGQSRSSSTLMPILEDEKKKRTLLQRLRSRKSSTSIPSGKGNQSTLKSGQPSSSSSSTATVLPAPYSAISSAGGKYGTEVATLPNGRKYIMIAVDYNSSNNKDTVNGMDIMPGSPISESVVSDASTPQRRMGGLSPSPPKRLSRMMTDSYSSSLGSKRTSVLIPSTNHSSTQMMTTFQDGHQQGRDQRRSIVIHTGGGEGSNFSLDSTPFLLDNFALDTDFIVQAGCEPSRPPPPKMQPTQQQHYHQQQQPQAQPTTQQGQTQTQYAQQQYIPRKTSNGGQSSSSSSSHISSNTEQNYTPNNNHGRSHRTHPSNGQDVHHAGSEGDMNRTGSKRSGNKVKFSTDCYPASSSSQPSSPRQTATATSKSITPVSAPIPIASATGSAIGSGYPPMPGLPTTLPTVPMNEESISRALEERIMSHKARFAKSSPELQSTSSPPLSTSSSSSQKQERTKPSPHLRQSSQDTQTQNQELDRERSVKLEQMMKDAAAVMARDPDFQLNMNLTTTSSEALTIPRPKPRKKVRHVQIQTQHCIMRPMYTQTEPMTMDVVVQELKCKEFSTQTTASTMTDDPSRGRDSTEDNGEIVPRPQSPSTTTTTTTTSTDTATSTTTTTTTTTLAGEEPSPRDEEMHQVQRQNAQLLTQVKQLERELASEKRARTRAAVAMQDTREKHEMLSAMAYKKLKEMIFQRHVLEMEMRELRAQLDSQEEVLATAEATARASANASGANEKRPKMKQTGS